MTADTNANTTGHPTGDDDEGIVLLRENRGRVTILTLNRPHRRNGLSEKLLQALSTELADIAKSSKIEVLIITGAAPTFCAGHDLKDMAAHRADPDGGHAYYTRIMGLCSHVMQAIVNCPQPVIAAVNGTAAAAGCQLVATCDLALASETAHFTTPGVNVGLFCSTPMVAMARTMRRKHALEMALLGGVMPAMMAMQYGLINRVVPEEDVIQEAMRWAGMISTKSPYTIRRGKAAFYRQIEMPLAEAYEFAARVMVDDLMAGDAGEGIAAFLQKRAPHWGGN